MLEWLKGKVKSLFEIKQEVAPVQPTPVSDVRDDDSVAAIAEENARVQTEHDSAVNEQINAAVRVARSRPAPSFIQKLLARVRRLITKVKAKLGNPIERLGSMFSGIIGGETGSLLNLLSVKVKALSTALHTLKAVEAGLNLIALVIETVKAAVSMVVEAVKSTFNTFVGFFTGCKDAVVEIFTPSQPTEGNAEENDHTTALTVLGLGAVGAGLLFSNRDKIPAAKEAMNEARDKATNIATATVDGAKDLTKDAFNHAYDLFVTCPEAQEFELHRQEALKGFNDVMDTVRNFSAQDARRFLTHALSTRNRV